MKKLPILLIAGALGAMASCDKDSAIGESLVKDKIDIYVDSSFTVTGSSQRIDRVISRTTSQLFGKIDAPGFGRFSSDIVTQFLSAANIYTTNVEVDNIDSLVLYMYVVDGNYVGDSITPMGIEVYRLNKKLPSPIYSDFDPTGYYDENDLLGSKIYNLCNESSDTIIDGSIEISIEMPKSLAKELFQAYLDDKSNFSSPSAFVDNVFKGVYIKNSYGSGRLSCSSSTMMTLFYHYYEEDSLIYGQGNYFAVTPEIITNNDIDIDISQEIMQKVSNGDQLVLAPAGLEVEMSFPAPEIIAAYKKTSANALQVLNTVSFFVPAEGVANDYGFDIPTTLLLVLSKDKEEFFQNYSMPDYETSFYATYSSTTGGYNFGDMSAYIKSLLEKDAITAEDYTFTIVPVYAATESSTDYYGQTTETLSGITPYMSAPVIAKLNLDQAKIKLTYASQTIEK